MPSSLEAFSSAAALRRDTAPVLGRPTLLTASGMVLGLALLLVGLLHPAIPEGAPRLWLPIIGMLMLAASTAVALSIARAAVQRQPIEEALHVAGIVMDSTAELVSVVDEHHVYQSVNASWCKATGIAREQAVGRRSVDVLPGAVSMERRVALEACIEHGQRTTVRDVAVFRNGSRHHLHTDFFPIQVPGGKRRLAALATRDVTLEENQRAELQTAADCLRGVLEATGDAIFAVDNANLDQPLRFANAQLPRLLGLPDPLPGELTLRVIARCLHEQAADPDGEQQRVDATVAAGVPAEHRILLRDGRVLHRRFARVMFGDRPLNVWSLRDVTTEHHAMQAREAAAAEQRLVLASFPGFITVMGDDLRYRFVNDRAARLLRLPAQQIIGRPAPEVLGQARWSALRPLLEQAQQSGQAVSHSSYPDEQGKAQIEVEVTHVSSPRLSDGSRTVYSFGVDITERKQAQAALAQALAEAERANRAKSQFLSRMSHELRTPLNAVLGFGQLLALQPLPPDSLQQVGEILHGGRHLLSLITDLLDLSRIEAGELEVVCEPVPAAAAIDDSLGLLRTLALEHRVDLRHEASDDPTICVWADPKRLRQVLLNLQSNAIKYNRPGGQVRVEAVRIGDELEFRVHDTGPGLSTEQQQRLFRPFERLGAHADGVDGTGIGLALSRNLVEAQGGRIGVRSQPGQGSSFWLRLPLAPLSVPAPPANAAAPHREWVPSPGQRWRALYIEDNPVNLLLMSAMLQHELELSTASDPLEGLDQAMAAPPDLILLDIQLPGIDGFEVLRRLRADERTRRIPVVAVTANAMLSDRAQGLAAGFAAYLTKPLDQKLLISTVHQLLGDRPTDHLRAANGT